MKVKIQKAAATPFGRVVAGGIIDLPDDIAKDWCKSKLAKRLTKADLAILAKKELAHETTAIEPPENAMLLKT